VTSTPRRLATALLAPAVALACGGAPRGDPDLVDLASVDPTIDVVARYAGSDNFVGAPVDGYGAPRCWLTRPAAEALAWVQRDLRSEGLGLRVYDCYRPQRAVDHFVRWAADPDDLATKAEHYPNVAKSRLFAEGYVAERSSHSRGSTVDLTLVRLADGEPLDMGSPWDFFDPVSHTDSQAVSREARSHRMRLRATMDRHGFENHPKEWWHYTLRDEPYPDRYRDVPIR
jgi:D-alanyl-D-alanine dipeptidase